MKRFKIIPLTLMFTLLAISSLGIDPAIAGWQTDPTGDADGISACDITRIDVDVTYHSTPVDDEIILKITLAEELIFNENTSGLFYAYNFYVDTDLSYNPNTSLLDSDDYEYLAHYDLSWSSDQWHNHSYLMATRYYLTEEAGSKVNGVFYWNPNTGNWEASNPGLDVAQIVGNTIVWDVTSAIYRENYIGTGAVVQGVATTSYNLNVKDRATESGWVDEFDNMCVYPSSSGTPSLPATGVVISMVFLAVATIGASIIRKRK